MVTMRRAGEDLVHRSTRRAFRELCTGTVLREIDGWWQDESFAPGRENNEVGDRRNRYQQYLDSVDWTHRPHVVRALRVFEQTALGIEAQHLKQPYDLLRRDGYEIGDDGQISGGPIINEAAVREESLANLAAAGAIREHLDRIGRALENEDPAQAIGSAKELVESTAKVVLRERGLTVDDKDDLPDLVRQASAALGVHPSTQSPGPDGSDAVKKILGGAVTITTGLAELRNRGFGTGHGAAAVPVGLGPRHAHLAVAGARLWCEFMLDTLADPKAPWRKIDSPPDPH
jgi:hypothetical protein